MATLYVILGIDKDATQQEIKQAYKKAALKTHPDRALPERKPEAEAAFKRIAEAYEVLGDPSSRRRYDRDILVSSPASSSSSDNFYFGTSPDSKPFTFQWESGHDSARRFASSRRPGGSAHGQQQRHPFGFAMGGDRFGAGMASSTDPFELFNHMFQADFASGSLGQSMADDPFFANHRRMADTNGFGFGMAPSRRETADPMMSMTSPFFGGAEDPFTSAFGPPMMSNSSSAFSGRNGSSSSTMQSFSSSSSSSGVRGGTMAASESRSTRTINGKTESHYRRVDPNGTETVHIKSQDGEKVFIDGVQQSSHPLLSSGNNGAQPLPIGARR